MPPPGGDEWGKRTRGNNNQRQHGCMLRNRDAVSFCSLESGLRPYVGYRVAIETMPCARARARVYELSKKHVVPVGCRIGGQGV